MVAKSDKKNISKNNKGCCNHNPEKEANKFLGIHLAIIMQKMYIWTVLELQNYILSSDFSILNSHHFVQHEVSKCNVGYKLNRSQGRKK